MVDNLKTTVGSHINNAVFYTLNGIRNEKDVTILNFSYGVYGYSLVINNKNGNIYRTDMFEVDLSSSVTGANTSINWGNYTVPSTPRELDDKIRGSSITIQACKAFCLGASTNSQNHMITTGLGTSQISYSGGSLVFSGYHLDSKSKTIVKGQAE